MTQPWDRSPQPKRGDPTCEAVYEAVGRALSHWEILELDLACLYAKFLGISGQEYVDARIFRERADVITSAACAYFVKHCNQEIESEFKRLIQDARLFSDRRNDIAHGVVAPVWNMAHPELDQFMLRPSNYKRKEFNSLGSPEYAFSSVEINAFAKHFQDFRTRIAALDAKILTRSRNWP
jgi:hypothetical protein